jgi:hypothetical protein
VVIALSAGKIETARFFERRPDDWPGDPLWMFRLLYGYGGEKWIATSEGIRTFFRATLERASSASDGRLTSAPVLRSQ